MANLTRGQAATILTALGWRTNTATRLTQAIKDFQSIWNLGAALSVDGVVGPKTSDALRLSYARYKAGKPDISANFRAREFQCKCFGKYAGCRRIWTPRKVVQLAERIRAVVGPWSPISAGRCSRHNAAVGGATRSQHLTALALDVSRWEGLSISKARELGATGIGYGGVSKTVQHVDFGPTRSWVYSKS